MSIVEVVSCEICKKKFFSSKYSLALSHICPECLQQEDVVKAFKEKKEMKKQKKRQKLIEEIENKLVNPSSREKEDISTLIELIKQDFVLNFGRYPTQDEIDIQLEMWRKIAKEHKRK